MEFRFEDLLWRIPLGRQSSQPQQSVRIEEPVIQASGMMQSSLHFLYLCLRPCAVILCASGQGLLPVSTYQLGGCNNGERARPNSWSGCG